MDDYLSTPPSYDEDNAFWGDTRVKYIKWLNAVGDTATLGSCRKPSLSEYEDEASE